MNSVLDKTEQKVFRFEDAVLWHYWSGSYMLPVPGVVVRQEEDRVVIRAHIEGSVREFAVAPEELTMR
jgi:hypothetical protein